jgi:hypothetical protein
MLALLLHVVSIVGHIATAAATLGAKGLRGFFEG